MGKGDRARCVQISACFVLLRPITVNDSYLHTLVDREELGADMRIPLWAPSWAPVVNACLELRIISTEALASGRFDTSPSHALDRLSAVGCSDLHSVRVTCNDQVSLSVVDQWNIVMSQMDRAETISCDGNELLNEIRDRLAAAGYEKIQEAPSCM